jgi:sugar lactone lactonase YvrE
MKRNSPVLHFFPLILAFGLFAGCKTIGIDMQDGDKTVVVSTIAGSVPLYADGPGSGARFFWPSGIAIDKAGNLYVADSGNHRIRKISPTGEVSTIAGSGATGEMGGGFADGQGSAALFREPSDIAIDAAGNLYVAENSKNQRIRKISPTGEVSTLAGSKKDYTDSTGSAARFHSPFGTVTDKAGNLYVADSENHRIRKISPTGEVSTLAGSEEGYADGRGSAAKFNSPSGIAIDAAGNLYVADKNNHRICKISPTGEVSTLAGSEEEHTDGTGSAARFHSPFGIAIDKAGDLYIADNNRIRKVTPKGEVSSFVGGKKGYADGPGSVAQFNWLRSIAIDKAGNLYVTDKNNHRIRKVSPTGKVSTLAGSEEGYADGRGSAAKFNSPSGIAIDAAGNLYVTDYENHRIRKISPTGEVSTLAGSEEGFADGPGSAARFYWPDGIAIGAEGNLYVVDSGNNRICKVSPAGEVSTLVGSESGFADGTEAPFFEPSDIAIDAAGNLYVADTMLHRIRKVSPTGELSTLAGGKVGSTDGPGSTAQFFWPVGIAIDKAGNLYVTDSSHVRKLVFVTNPSRKAGKLQ